MANYAASVVATAQMMLNQDFQKAEMRSKPSAVFMTALKNRSFLMPDIKTLRLREDRPTKAYLLNRAERTAGSARSASHTGTVGDSTEVNIAYSVASDVFKTSMKRADNNLFTDAEIMKHEIQNALINIHDALETAGVTFLDTNKNQVSDPPSGSLKRASFNATNDIYEIGADDENEFFNIIKSIFRQEKYAGSSFDIIADSLKYSKGEFLMAQNQANATNLGWQFSGLNVAESIELADSDYTSGICFGVPSGMFGVLDWIPKQNREGHGDFMTYNGGFATITDPMTGLQLALHGYTARADTASANGNIQDETTEWELSLDYSYQVAPLTTANASPIFGFGQTL